MIQTLQYGLPLASLTVDSNNHALMKEGGQKSAIRQFRCRIDVGGLLQRPIPDRPVICRFLYHAGPSCGCQLKTVIGRPPTPKNLPIPVELEQEVQASACYKIATTSLGDGVERIEQGRTHHTAVNDTHTRTNHMDPTHQSNRRPTHRSYNPPSH